MLIHLATDDGTIMDTFDTRDEGDPLTLFCDGDVESIIAEVASMIRRMARNVQSVQGEATAIAGLIKLTRETNTP